MTPASPNKRLVGIAGRRRKLLQMKLIAINMRSLLRSAEAEALTEEFVEAWVRAWAWTLPIDVWRCDRTRMATTRKG